MINVLNGTLDMGVGEIEELRSQIDAKQVRLLGVLAENRLEEFPDLPTVQQQGIDVAVTKFRGLAGPKGMPKEIAATWEAAMRRVLADPAYKKIYSEDSLIPTLMGQDKARAFTNQFAGDVKREFRDLGIIR